MCEGWTMSTVLFLCQCDTVRNNPGKTHGCVLQKQFWGVREAATGRSEPCGIEAYKNQRSGQAAVGYDCSHLLKSALPAAVSFAFPAAEVIKNTSQKSYWWVVLSVQWSQSLFMWSFVFGFYQSVTNILNIATALVKTDQFYNLLSFLMYVWKFDSTSGGMHLIKVLYLRISNFMLLFYLYSTTFQREMLYVLLHYINFTAIVTS